jgi:hypothetical protein
MKLLSFFTTKKSHPKQNPKEDLKEDLSSRVKDLFSLADQDENRIDNVSILEEVARQLFDRKLNASNDYSFYLWELKWFSKAYFEKVLPDISLWVNTILKRQNSPRDTYGDIDYAVNIIRQNSEDTKFTVEGCSSCFDFDVYVNASSKYKIYIDLRGLGISETKVTFYLFR